MADKNLPAVASIAPVLAAAEALEARMLSVEGIEQVVSSTIGEVIIKTNLADRANIPRIGTQSSVVAEVEAEVVARDRATASINRQALAQERLNAAATIGADLATTTAASTARAARSAGVRSSATGVVFGETPTRRTPRTSGLGLGGVSLTAEESVAAQEARAAAAVLATQRFAAPPTVLPYSQFPAGPLATPPRQPLLLGPGGTPESPTVHYMPPAAGGSWGGPPPGGWPRPTAGGAGEPPGGGGGGDFISKSALVASRANQETLTLGQLRGAWQENNADLGRFNNTLTRHGYLTSEVIQAAQRGELTYAEWGSQIAGTAAKFAAWTAVSIPIFGAIAAFRKLYDGAVETSQGIAFMQRSIDNVNTDRATSELQNLSQHFNIPIKDAATAVGTFGRIFHTQAEASAAAPVALYAEKLNNLDVTTAATRFTAIANEFKIPAANLQQLGDQMTQGMLRFGTSIDVSSQALATAGGTWHAAGGDISTLLALIISLNRTGANTGTIGTAISQSIVQVQQPKNVQALAALGINERNGNYQQLVLDILAKAKSNPEDITALAQAMGNARTTRIFPALLQNPALFEKVLATTAAGAPGVKGAQERELQHQLSGASEQLNKMGVMLENIGSSLVKSGGLTSFKLLLGFINSSLTAINELIGAFNSIPNPFREIIATGTELLVIWRALKALNVGRGIGQGGQIGVTNPDGTLTTRGWWRQQLTPDAQKERALSIVKQSREDVVARSDEQVAAQRSYSAALVNAERKEAQYQEYMATVGAQMTPIQAEREAALNADRLAANALVVQTRAQVGLATETTAAYVAVRAELLALGRNYAAINAAAPGLGIRAFGPLAGTGQGVLGPALGRTGAEAGAAETGAFAAPLMGKIGGTTSTETGVAQKVNVAEIASVKTSAAHGSMPTTIVANPAAAIERPIAAAEAPVVNVVTGAGAAAPGAAAPAVGEAVSPGLVSVARGSLTGAAAAAGRFLGPGGGAGSIGGNLTSGFFTYLIGSTIAQVIEGAVGANKTVRGLGTDAAIGAGIGTAIPVVGPALGALGGLTVGVLTDLFHSDSAANAKALAALTPGPGTNAKELQKAVNDYRKSNAVANEQAINAAALANLGSPGVGGSHATALGADVSHPGGAAYAYAPYPDQTTTGPGFHQPVPESSAALQAAADQGAISEALALQNQQPLGGGTPTPFPTTAPGPQSIFGNVVGGLPNLGTTPFTGASVPAAPPSLKDMPPYLHPGMSIDEMVKATTKEINQRTIRPGELKPGLDQGVVNSTRQREIIASEALPYLHYSIEQLAANRTPAGSKARQEAIAAVAAGGLQILTAANPQSSASERGFLGYYNSLGGAQVAYDSFVKDTLSEQGLHTPIGKTMFAHAQQIASFDNSQAQTDYARSLSDVKPSDRKKDFKAADAFASEAYSLVQTTLSAASTDLQNSLAQATNGKQVDAAYRDAISKLRTEARKDPFAAPQIKAAITTIQQQQAQTDNSLETSKVALRNTLDPGAFDVASRNVKLMGDIVQRDIAVFGRGSQITIDAMTQAAAANNSALQAALTGIQAHTDLLVSQAHGDTLAIDALQSGGIAKEIARIQNSNLKPGQKKALIAPLIIQRNNQQTQSTADNAAYINTLHSGQTAEAIANAGNNQSAVDAAIIAGDKQKIHDLLTSGAPQDAITSQLPALRAQLTSDRNAQKKDQTTKAVDYTSTLHEGQTALAIANAGNNTVAADRAAVAGAKQAITDLQSSGKSQQEIAAELPGLYAALKTSETTLINDTTDQANALATSAIQLAAGIGNDPTKIGRGNVASALEVLKRGHFKHPQDKNAAEKAYQDAKYNQDQINYDDLNTRLDLTRASVGTQINALLAFAKKMKGKNKVVYDEAMQKVIQLESSDAGSYELNVGGGSLPFPTAYQARRSEHALNYPHAQQGSPWHVNAPKKDERPVWQGNVTIVVNAAHDAAETARQVATHLKTVMERNTRASRRSSLIR